ncbi:TnsD family Tn7-like transposition protein [Occallatibacter riparius]|uniref:TnsD family Tn7-like transposition protein n=1 Tax=Occallatibacter riparius TaxID=1002689 RepID=UPI0036F429DA
MESLIDENTLWPYWAAFQSRERRSRTRMEMAGAGNAYLSLGLMASALPWLRFFRYCLSCVDLDRAAERETYWHRVHQIPSIEVCPSHGERLLDSQVQFRQSRNRYEYRSAESAIASTSGLVRKKPKMDETSSDAAQLQLAKSAAWLLAHPQASRSGVELRTRLVSELALRGFATWNGTVRVSRLVSSITSRYPAKWLEAIGCGFPSPPHENWLERLFRRPESTQATIRYLLLVNFLETSVESILRTEMPAPFGKPPWPCLNKASNHFGQLTIPMCEIATTRNGTALVGRFACLDCGMIYVRLGPDASAADREQPQSGAADRMRRDWVPVYGPEWNQTLIRGWGEADTSMRKLADRLGVDARTVRLQTLRLGLEPVRDGSGCRETPVASSMPVAPANAKGVGEYRSQWLQLQRDHPSFARSRLREAAPALYTFLYRHDPLWLGQHSPLPRRSTEVRSPVDWNVRDVALSDEVDRAAERLLLRRPLVRLTFTAMLREASSTWALTKLSRLPLTGSALKLRQESRVDFAIRRIQEVSAAQSLGGSTPLRWRLVRAANIRPDLLILKAVEDAIQVALIAQTNSRL